MYILRFGAIFLMICIASCKSEIESCDDMSGVLELIGSVYDFDLSDIREPLDVCELEAPSSETILHEADRVYGQCPSLCADEFVKFFSYYNGSLRFQEYFCDTIDDPGVEAAQEQFKRRIANLRAIAETLDVCLGNNLKSAQ